MGDRDDSRIAVAISGVVQRIFGIGCTVQGSGWGAIWRKRIILVQECLIEEQLADVLDRCLAGAGATGNIFPGSQVNVNGACGIVTWGINCSQIVIKYKKMLEIRRPFYEAADFHKRKCGRCRKFARAWLN